MMNKSFENGSELWNMPWHTRLKNVAEVAATSGPYCFKAIRAQSAHTAQSAGSSNSAGSWLGRARCRAASQHACIRF